MLSDHFSLSHFPFSGDTDFNGLFECPQFESTYDELLMGVIDGRRIQLVIGPSGSGRTTLLGRIRAGLQPSEFQPVRVRFTNLNSEEMQASLLQELTELDPTQQPQETDDELVDKDVNSYDELRRRLALFRDIGRPVVFLVDDGETLSASCLNQLPELLEAEDEDNLAQIVIAVRPEFAQRLTGIELETLNAAIDGILQLESWDRTTVTDFVCAAIESASGVAGDIFTEDAIVALFDYSEGIPARINTLCGSAMREAEAQGKHRVTPEHIHSVATGILAAIETASTDALPASGRMDLDDLETLSMDDDYVSQRRLSRPSLVHQIWWSLLEWRTVIIGQWSHKHKIVAAASGLALLGVSATLLLGALSTQPEPSNVDLAQTNPKPFMGSKVIAPRSTREETPKLKPEREAISELTSTIGQLARALTDMEARLGSQEQQVKTLQETVHSLATKPVTVPAKTHPVVPSKTTSVAQTREQPSTFVKSLAPGMSSTEPKLATPSPKNVAGASTISSGPIYIGKTHKVKRGETLWGIATEYGLTVDQIAAANTIAPEKPLKIGETLRLDAAGTLAQTVTSWYTVKRGDSLYSIGQRFQVPPQQLALWNCMTRKEVIFPGQRITIAAPTTDADCTKRG